MKVENMDPNLLKSIADSLMNEIESGLIFFANIKNEDNVNYICRSNCNINAGFIVKNASISSDGNGGGSNTFAQGGGKTTQKLDTIFEYVEKALSNE